MEKEQIDNIATIQRKLLACLLILKSHGNEHIFLPEDRAGTPRKKKKIFQNEVNPSNTIIIVLRMYLNFVKQLQNWVDQTRQIHFLSN